VVVLVERQVELREDVGDVLLDGALGDDKLGGDSGVRAALGGLRPTRKTPAATK
jgi:hypothetical protein